VSEEIDRLIRDYLENLKKSLRGIAEENVDEVVREIRTHIEDAVRSKTEGERPPELQTVQRVLEKLGDPKRYGRELAIAKMGMKLDKAKYCPYCGAELAPRDVFCAECGRPTEKPIGVYIISVLSILAGASMIFRGALLFVSPYMMRRPPLVFGMENFIIVVMLELVIGGVLLPTGIGLWKLKKWGWCTAIVASILIFGNAVYDLIGGAVVTHLRTTSMIVAATMTTLILLYLVARRKFFGIKW